MNRTNTLVLALAAAGLLSACASTPKQIEELETARAIVPQVEASPRAGVAATNIAEARKALDQANKLADKGGKLEDITFAANAATKNAQIANEKILTAQAREDIEKGTAERQAVLLESREHEAQASADRAKSLESELADMKAKKTDRGLVVTLGDVLFDTGQATLKPGAYSTIDRLAQALKGSSDRKVIIEGYTDSVGSEDYNQGLSERRAQSVQAALFERGVASNQISTVGKGEGSPVASNDTAAGRQANRRVEMIFQEGGAQVATDTN
jgi:outer membrane protein OmpA-like peptidoglycan-associated protein